MSFNGTEGALISQADAQAYTANYRNQNPNAIIAQYMGKDLIEDILGQQGCMGVRIYKGINADGQERFIFVGVDANENDMVDGVLVDASLPSPPYSSSANIING